MTEKGAAIDTIFVRTPEGSQVGDSEALAALQRDLEAAISLIEPEKTPVAVSH